MDEFKKIELRMSEIRTELNANMALEAPTPEEVETRMALQTEYTEAEKRYQDYLRGAISEEERRNDEDRPEVREYRRMVSESRLSRYFSMLIEGRMAPDGVEGELNQSLKIPGMSVPMEVFAPARGLPDDGRIEHRQDVSTTIAAAGKVPVQGHPILGRAFAYSDVEFLGLTQVMAGVGEQTFPVLTGGVSPEYKGPGVVKNAEAATYTFDQLPPLAYQARYKFRREDIARLAMYEDSLRRDLSMAMANFVSDAVINGTVANDGVLGFRPQASTNKLGGAAVLLAANTLAQFLGEVNHFPDGVYAARTSDVCVMLSQPVNAKINGTLDGANQPHFMSELLKDFQAYKVSGHLKEETIGGQKRRGMMVIAKGMWTPGSTVLVMWPSVDLIYDPFTAAGTREVIITAAGLWNFKILRADPWRLSHVRID